MIFDVQHCSGDDSEEREERCREALIDVLTQYARAGQPLSADYSFQARLAADELLMILRAGGSARDVADYLLYQGVQLVGGQPPSRVEDVMPLVQELLRLFGKTSSH
jgi:hypothetical protein